MKLLQGLQHEPITSFNLTSYETIAVGATVQDVLQQLRAGKHNSGLIVQDGRLVGIFTDRDAVRQIVDRPALWEQPIENVMTTAVQTVDENATAAEALDVMERYHVRNVPVLRANGEVLGNFTYASVVQFLADTFPIEIYNRPPDHTRFARRQHGG